VDDPLDAEPFLPTLKPALAFAADAMSDPEVSVCVGVYTYVCISHKCVYMYVCVYKYP
jgi:hypothetical protein